MGVGVHDSYPLWWCYNTAHDPVPAKTGNYSYYCPYYRICIE
jgi:hypothetical protein